MTKSNQNADVIGSALAHLLVGALIGGATVAAVSTSSRNRRLQAVREMVEVTLQAARAQLQESGFVQLLLPWDADGATKEAYERVAQRLMSEPHLLYVHEQRPEGGRSGIRFYTEANRDRYLADRLEMHFLKQGRVHGHRA